MLYVCGMLFSDAPSIKTLRIEILEWEGGVTGLGGRCPSWLDTGLTGWTELLDFAPSPNSKTEYIAFLLKPLELLGRVENCEIAIAEDNEENITPDLQATLKSYKDALTDRKPFSNELSEWLWDEYVAILDCEQQIRREQRKAEQEEHEAWLLRSHQRFSCLHQRRGKRYSRWGKMANCEGCGRWLAWLLDCRRCRLRACRNCTNELKEKRPALEEAVRREERKRPVPEQ
ncbi:MAG: hypothetical protein Q9208_003910 [Pyrenodesmia sp. 3 TL-2023]